MVATPRSRVRVIAAFAGAVALAAAVPALAGGTPAVAPSGVFDDKPSNDAHFAEGEPSIAVNPTNPDNIIVTFLSNTGFGTYGLQNNTAPVGRDFGSTIQACDYVVSFDGGATWRRHKLPLASFAIDPTRPNCSDTVVLFNERGAAYVVGGAYQIPTFAVGEGDFRVIRSYNGGRTWTRPAVVSPTYLSPHPKPVQWKGLRFYDDREFMAYDESTQTLYVDGTQGRADAKGGLGDTEYLVSSTDGGRTWGDALHVGVAAASPLGAAHGIVGFTSPPPVGATRACTCLDFVVSTDKARSIVRRTTPIPSNGTPTGLMSSAATAADPSAAGHFAVAAVSGDELLVFRTADAGRTWSSPSTLRVPGRGVSKTWIAYSPTGVLGVGWRGTKGDGGYGFYAAASYDNGATWTTQRLSHADSPPNDHLYVAGDDTSAITLTTTMLYATWGDWRGHELHTWWGGMPLHQ